jgi:GT2 family glycosyltransferase
MKTNVPKVVIVILNWNGLADTVECLHSLLKIAYSNYEIVVIDNGSRGNDASILEEKFGKLVDVIRSKTNVGFAGGCNIGIRWAMKTDATYMLFLNNDTTVERRFLEELLEVAESDEKIGIVGSKIYYYDDRRRIATVGATINFWTGNAPLIGRETIDHGEFTKVREVDYVSGCALLIKREVIQRIGTYDERYFAYYEETDLCTRARRLGYKIVVAPKSMLWHKVSRSDKSGEISWYFMTRNRFLFMKKNATGIHFPFFVLYFLSTDFILKMESAKLFKKPRLFNAYLKGAFDGLRIALGARPEKPTNLR